MKHCDLLNAPSRLDKSLKTLRLRWEDTKEQWRDQVAAEFESNYLEVLESQVLGVLERMRSLAGTMSAAEQECGPDEW